MSSPPIVMQTLWRTRGTYFWSLFRKNPRIRAFDEPLHEGLANKTDQQWFFDFKFGSRRTLRHPTVDRHYFAEYPMRPQGGVPLFNRSLSFDRFIQDETDEDACLADYLRSLVRFATTQDQQAYFRFTRGGLRAALIQRILGGTQIYSIGRRPSCWCRTGRLGRVAISSLRLPTSSFDIPCLSG
jgi:hypothetical protein